MGYRHPRLPLADLLYWQGTQNVQEWAKITDVHQRRAAEYAADGIPFHTADRLAIRAGLHPGTVWGAEWWSACRVMDEIDQAKADTRTRRNRSKNARRERVREMARAERLRERAA